ncbi:MAG: hypothetical protein EPN91_05755 [Salinibacterium sp.]|nr:MAG: hypothetical protein EPN91_05755 [Salinibacterium sp.]
MDWQQQEPGWHTSKLGGIVQERGKWFFWPLDPSVDSVGPWASLKDAKAAAEAWIPPLTNGERDDAG